MNVTEFLTARLDEEEATAGRHGDGKHRIHLTDDVGTRRWDCPDCLSLDGGMRARVLAEIEAKRRIVAEWHDPESIPVWDREMYAEACGIDFAVRTLAAISADHPDYDPDDFDPGRYL